MGAWSPGGILARWLGPEDLSYTMFDGFRNWCVKRNTMTYGESFKALFKAATWGLWEEMAIDERYVEAFARQGDRGAFAITPEKERMYRLRNDPLSFLPFVKKRSVMEIATSQGRLAPYAGWFGWAWPTPEMIEADQTLLYWGLYFVGSAIFLPLMPAFGIGYTLVWFPSWLAYLVRPTPPRGVRLGSA